MTNATSATKPTYLSCAGFAVSGPTKILRLHAKDLWYSYEAVEDAGDGNAVLDHAVIDVLVDGCHGRWRGEVIEMLAHADRITWDQLRAYEAAQKTADAVAHARQQMIGGRDEWVIAELSGGPGAAGEHPPVNDSITIEDVHALRAAAAAAYAPIQAVVDEVIVRLSPYALKVDEARQRIAARRAQA